MSGSLFLALMGDPEVSKEVQGTLLAKGQALATATSGLAGTEC